MKDGVGKKKGKLVSGWAEIAAWRGVAGHRSFLYVYGLKNKRGTS